jgi:hypothetical protein
MDSFIQAYPVTGYAQKNKKQNKTKKKEKKHKQLE